MKHSDYFYLGRIHKTVGNKGELSATFETDQPQTYANITTLFIDIKRNLIPFTIKKIHFKGAKVHILLEDINTKSKAEFLCGCSLHLPINLLPKLKGNQFYYHEVIGFTVEDKVYGQIGKIKNIIDQSSQAIFQIIYQDKEILIPITQKFIQNVDRKKKVIYVDTPEGLIDLYLQVKKT